NELSLSPDGKWLAASQGRITVWDTTSGKECSSFVCNEYPGTIAFTDDGTALAVLGRAQIRFGDPATGRERSAKALPDVRDEDLPLPRGWGQEKRWGRGLSVRVRNGPMRIDDFPGCKRRCEFRDPDWRERIYAFSPDGKRLATGGKDSFIRIRDTANGKE